MKTIQGIILDALEKALEESNVDIGTKIAILHSIRRTLLTEKAKLEESKSI